MTDRRIRAHVAHHAARAASLSERADPAGCFVPLPTSTEVVASRLERWQVATGAADASAFDALLARRGIGDPSHHVADVALADDDRLPAWAEAFCWLFANVPPVEERTALAVHMRSLVIERDNEPHAGPRLRRDRSAPSTSPQQGVFVPFYVAARDFAASCVGRPGAAPGACDPAAAHLVAMLARAAIGSLGTPTSQGDTTWLQRLIAADDLIDGWLEVTTEFPLLIRVLGTYAANWKDATSELLHRLDVDADAITATFLSGEAAVLTECRTGQGDPHRGLRTVSLLRFAGGEQVVYKPRSLAAVDSARRLMDELVPGQRALLLPRVLLRDGYGWEEFVAQSRPVDPAGWNALAHHAGQSLRLLSAIGANDVTAPNVAVRDERLHLVDAETLLPGSVVVDKEGRAKTPAAAIRATGLVSAVPLAERRGVPAVDVGALAQAEARPILERPDQVLRGFARAHAEICREPRAIRSELVADLRLRTLMRSTYVYEHLVAMAARAERTRDAFTHDFVFERLWLAYFETGIDPGVIEAEAAAVRIGDMPIFEMLADDTCALVDDRPAIEGVLETSPRAAANALLEELTADDLAEHLELVRSMLYSAGPDVEVGAVFDGDGPPAFGDAPSGGWLPRARSVAGEIAAWLRLPESSHWLCRLHWNGQTTLAANQPDLLNGHAGLAIVLTELTELTDDADEHVAAVATRLDEYIGVLVAGHSPSGVPPDAGGYVGIGSLIYALHRLGVNDVLAEQLVRLADVRLPNVWSRDLAIGIAGLGCALAACRPDVVPSPLLEQVIDRLQAEPGDDDPVADAPTGAAFSPYPAVEPSRLHALASLGIVDEAAIVRYLDEGRWVDGSVERLLAVALARRIGVDVADRACAPDLPIDSSEALLIELEVSVEAGDIARAERALALIEARRVRSGRWFPERLASDRHRPSALWGVGAVAYGMARVAEPDAYPSLWLLDASR